jgi:CheY-like chemotaxis protein
MPESLRILILEDNRADTELVQFELPEAGIVFISKVVMTEEEAFDMSEELWLEKM